MLRESNIPFAGEGGHIGSTGLKILIVDDDNISRKILSRNLVGYGHRAVTAKNGQEGVELFERENPDLVIMDIMMPVMDGYEATRIIKEKAGGSFIPVICLTAMEDEEGLAKCIAAGADDFLSKPVTPTILNAKIDSMMRIRGLYNTVNAQKDALGVMLDEKDREMAFAEKIHSQIVYRGSMEEPNVRYWICPMAIFSGDLLLMDRSPSGHLHVLMGDFTGHGLSAAIGAIPASEIFYTMTGRECSINEIAMELNRKLKRLLPSNIFLAAVLVRMDSARCAATVWSGAVPDIFIIEREGGLKKRIRSRNLPLGVVDNDMLGSTVEVTGLADGDRLCVFSDGVTEAVRPDGEMFGEERLEECLNQNRGGLLLEEVKAAVDTFCEGQSRKDDVTMVEIICDGNAPLLPCPTPSSVREESDQCDWQVVVELEPNKRRDVDPLPMIMDVLMQDDGLVQHKENLFLIISELFTNALDYGVLGMDGSLKQTVEGMIQYFSEREKALTSLETGAIRIEIKHTTHQNESVFMVGVEDSGPGFDYRREGASLSETGSMGGRGLQLVRSLCKEIVFQGRGNKVEASYTFNV